ncbi:DUF1168-domain-containing protein [Coprinopsis sp. MPI-PUGE-AT-0042]|nr:DUF1168-domain-containing protein [Coprinopsis sp. MPI-PUGE-AT-0042]
MASASPSPGPSTSNTGPSAEGGTGHKHALTPLDKQRNQLSKLFKDPTKAAYIPAPPKEKTIRAPREMMKNVQGSSAGAGSGEFHVYKAARRREYERLKLLEEESLKEQETAEFERKRKEIDSQFDAKTAKNRAKRQKKKERAREAVKSGNPNAGEEGAGESTGRGGDAPMKPIKKRRLVNGKELVFKRPGEESDSEDGEDGEGRGAEDDAPGPRPPTAVEEPVAVKVVETPRITIIEDDF